MISQKVHDYDDDNDDDDSDGDVKNDVDFCGRWRRSLFKSSFRWLS